MTAPVQTYPVSDVPPRARRGILDVFLEPASGSRGRVACLDGFRGVAVAVVVLSHLDGSNAGVTGPLHWTGAGKYGVYLFFVLSSFLLGTQLLSRPDAQLRSPRVWRDYFVRRVLRIYPAYLLVLLAHVALHRIPGLEVKAPATLPEVYDHLLLRAGAEVFWTIPVECKFYFVLPLVVVAAVFVLRRRPLAVTAALVLAVAASTMTLGRSFELHPNRPYLAPLLDVFLAGCLVAHLHGLVSARQRFTPALRWSVEALAWLALAAVLVFVPSIWTSLGLDASTLPGVQQRPLVFALLWGVCLLGSLHGSGALAAVMSLPPLRFLGAVSFSLYLWHYTVLVLLGQRLAPSAAVGWIVIGISVGLAIVSYLLVERPALRLGRRLVAGPRGTSPRSPRRGPGSRALRRTAGIATLSLVALLAADLLAGHFVGHAGPGAPSSLGSDSVEMTLQKLNLNPVPLEADRELLWRNRPGAHCACARGGART